ncbi:MAG: cell envelope integrity protein TolA, partial [Gammaproteobacteria bacterium]
GKYEVIPVYQVIKVQKKSSADDAKKSDIDPEAMLEKQLEKKQKKFSPPKKAEKLQTLQEQLAAETEAEESAADSAAMQGEIDKYKGLILEALRQHWIVPDNISPEMFTTLLIRLAPDGMVVTVQLTKSSGDPTLDRSAIAAVYKASPLPVSTDIHLFGKMREILLDVKPESK